MDNYCIVLISTAAFKLRVARWYVFRPKSKKVNFGGPWNEKVGIFYLWPFGLYYGPLVYLMAIW
jgi:hypothetical protein